MKSLLVFLIAACVLGLSGVVVWKLIGPKEEDLGPFLQPILEEVVAEAVSKLPRDKMPEAVFIAPVRGDVLGQVKALLKREIKRRGLSQVVDRATLGERLGGEGFVGTLLREVFGGDPKLPLDLKKASSFLRRARLPGLILCRAQIEENERQGSVSVSLKVLKAPGEIAAFLSSKKSVPKSLLSWPYLRSRILSISIGWRLLGWAVFVLLLPVLLSPFLFRILRRESNLANALAILGLTAFSAFVLWFFLGLSGSTLSALSVALLGLGASGVYHYLMLEFFEDLRR